MNKSKKENSQSQSKRNKVSDIEDFLNKNYEFRYNEVTMDTEYRPKGETLFRPVDERSFADIRLELERENYSGFIGILNALLKSNQFPESFNPFKAYYETLPKWDGKDHISELAKYVGLKDSEDRPWLNTMLTKHLVRTVACSLRKIPFNKYCFVLQGRQNDGKSSFVRFLCPPSLKDYYKENPPLDHKDSIIALGENIIINLDELDGLSKADISKIKSLFSMDNPKVRTHYAIRDTIRHRYASFFGTINEREFLNDVTGNVRWLIIEIDGIQHDNAGPNGYNQNIDINKVWAQAYALVMQGETGSLTSDEIKQVEERNRRYQRTTAEMDLVPNFFSPSKRGNDNTFAVTATNILDAIQYASRTTSKLNQVLMGRALTHLKFEKSSIRLESGKNPTNRYIVTSENKEVLDFLRSHADYLPT